MPTTLTEARRALLELLSDTPRAYAAWRSRLTTIGAYLDEQVALNVENLPSQIRGNTFDLLIIDDPLARVGGVEDKSSRFVFASGGDKHALRADLGDRRFFVGHASECTCATKAACTCGGGNA